MRNDTTLTCGVNRDFVGRGVGWRCLEFPAGGSVQFRGGLGVGAARLRDRGWGRSGEFSRATLAVV